MRLGINFTPYHTSPEEWAEIISKAGYRASCFPTNYKAPVSLIDRYVKAAKDNDILIAEVGVWNSPFSSDPEKAKANRDYCVEQYRLADYVKANCCVNVSGSVGEVWDFVYKENFTPEMYERNVEFVRYLIDTVKPKNTPYSLEPMPWMIPSSVGEYRCFIDDVDSPFCKVHMDIFNFVNTPYLYAYQEKLMDEAFELLGKDIVSCHIKDIKMAQGATVAIHEAPIGEGVWNQRYYLEKINALNPDMPVLIEHLGRFEDYNKALAHLKSLNV